MKNKEVEGWEDRLDELIDESTLVSSMLSNTGKWYEKDVEKIKNFIRKTLSQSREEVLEEVDKIIGKEKANGIAPFDVSVLVRDKFRKQLRSKLNKLK